MKKLLSFTVVTLLLMGGGWFWYEQSYGTTDYYTKITSKGERVSIGRVSGREHFRYKYNLASYTSENNEKDVFTIFGDGSQTRDFVYVEDVLQALKLVSEKEEALGEVFNVGTGAPSSINDVLGIYESEMNIKPIIQFEESRKGDIKDSVADISKLKKIGFSPNYSLDEGIAEYLKEEIQY